MTRTTRRPPKAWLTKLLGRRHAPLDVSATPGLTAVVSRLPAPADGRPRASAARLGQGEPSLAELQAEAAYSRDRLALYRRRMTLGRGDPSRLRALERVADGASDRLDRARDRRADHA